ncbi:protein of unknown function [Methylocella tundrae]|uniref:Uncharacterized protein n=1 Tax=Methylocella tundrae TaxID=227605 RepID=A0A4U8YVC2_METTU|nr:protein of unknown function [Methylocella tundrae]
MTGARQRHPYRRPQNRFYLPRVHFFAWRLNLLTRGGDFAESLNYKGGPFERKSNVFLVETLRRGWSRWLVFAGRRGSFRASKKDGASQAGSRGGARRSGGSSASGCARLAGAAAGSPAGAVQG